MVRGSFQYSLCRVVLMVAATVAMRLASYALSVLALSSRFDGLQSHFPPSRISGSFSTRSVESF